MVIKFKLAHTYKSQLLAIVNVRIPYLRIAHWGVILRWVILIPSVIRSTHPKKFDDLMMILPQHRAVMMMIFIILR